MKITWGTGIVIAIALFMSFILYFVLKVQSDSTYDHELVTEEYYKKELDFQNQINKRQNSLDKGYGIKIEKTADGIQFKFPMELNKTAIRGTVYFYRPSDQRLDFEYQISNLETDLLIPNKSLVEGRWDITIDWQYEGKNYFTEQTFYY